MNAAQLVQLISAITALVVAVTALYHALAARQSAKVTGAAVQRVSDAVASSASASPPQ